MLQPGIEGRVSMTVAGEHTAAAMGSGELQVLATPAMIALMERAAWESVTPCLEPGQGTVGTMMQVEHTAATPVGMKVTAMSELTEIDGRSLTFRVTACDERGPVGEGVHRRFVVDNERFQKKADGKSERCS